MRATLRAGQVLAHGLAHKFSTASGILQLCIPPDTLLCRCTSPPQVQVSATIARPIIQPQMHRVPAPSCCAAGLPSGEQAHAAVQKLLLRLPGSAAGSHVLFSRICCTSYPVCQYACLRHCYSSLRRRMPPAQKLISDKTPALGPLFLLPLVCTRVLPGTPAGMRAAPCQSRLCRRTSRRGRPSQTGWHCASTLSLVPFEVHSYATQSASLHPLENPNP